MPRMRGSLTGNPSVILCVEGRAIDRHAAITYCQAFSIKIVEMVSQVFLVQPRMVVSISVVVTGTQLFVERSTASGRGSHPREDVGSHDGPQGSSYSVTAISMSLPILSGFGAEDGGESCSWRWEAVARQPRVTLAHGFDSSRFR